MELTDKVALVTGAGRGIGSAIATTLAEYGCDVVVNDVASSLGRAQQVVQDIERLGRRGKVIEADVSDHERVQHMFEQTLQAFGHLDILVNNAGIIRRGTLVDHTLEDWDRVLGVNLWGPFHCVKRAVPIMVEQGHGKIINISSIAGKVGDLASAPSYGASKGALNAFTKAMARELAPYGITVNAVAPHAIETEMSQEWPDEKRQQIIASIPLGRLGTPREVAETVAFLASDGADFITGEILDVNGGYLMD
jgi:3-oxoacyl-[acyl-carrier protein] reductase